MKQLRTQPSVSGKGTLGVDREKGVIYGYSVIERGPDWNGGYTDDEFMAQLEEAGNATTAGIKTRFTHPGLCADGLGTLLGRSKNFRREGNRLRADLHLAEHSRDTPNGNLREYVLTLAESDPDGFGASIAWMEDAGAIDVFEAQHRNEAGVFESPEEDNPRGFTHHRLATFIASDLVDTPAANRGGLFGSPTLAHGFEKLADAALGLMAGGQEPVALGITQDGARAFLNDYLERKGLMITRKTTSEAGVLSAPDGTAGGAGASVAERNGSAATLAEGPPMEEEEEEQASAETEDDELTADGDEDDAEEEMADDAPPASEEDEEEESGAELSAGRRRVARLRAALGADVSAETLLSAVEEGLSVGQALRRENEQLRAQVVELGKGKGFSGAAKPMASFQPGEKKAGSSTPKSYLALVEERKKETGCSTKLAREHVVKNHPEAFEAYQKEFAQ